MSSQTTQGRFTEDFRFETRRTGVRGGAPYFALAATGDFGGGTVYVEAGIEMSDGVLHFFPVPDVQLQTEGYIVFAVACDVVAVSMTGSTNPDVLWALR